MSKRYAPAFASTLALALTMAVSPHGMAKDTGKGGRAVLLPAAGMSSIVTDRLPDAGAPEGSSRRP